MKINKVITGAVVAATMATAGSAAMAMAVTKIQWWHAMGGANGNRMNMRSNQSPAPATDEQSDTGTADGKQVFFNNCTACHQEDAEGIAGAFPPLANNSDLFLARDFPAKVLLNGMAGTIKVNGAGFEGEMPPFGHLSDGDIAAVVNFLRGSFGNIANAPANMKPLSPGDVGNMRKTAMTPSQVHAYRASLK